MSRFQAAGWDNFPSGLLTARHVANKAIPLSSYPEVDRFSAGFFIFFACTTHSTQNVHNRVPGVAYAGELFVSLHPTFRKKTFQEAESFHQYDFLILIAIKEDFMKFLIYF